ncbi:uncharacterized protein LOC143474592 [Brachyhypopomus gauderio]|uniref:uncharacterized protein LOC143474592 n=1 Tax=Brachyhypopomus gauderio TaxID=698409 RepID=UPI0040422419
MNMLLLFTVITLPSIADSADSGIRPDETVISLTEGSSTTLSCTYDGSPYSLHWYLQKPGSRPEFLLLIIQASEYVIKAEPAHRKPRYTEHQMFHHKNRQNLQWSNRPVIMFSITILCVWLSLGDSMADPIEPLFPHNAVLQGDNVTLSCSYKQFSGNLQNLHWYRQYPQSRPEFLLYIYPSGAKSEPLPHRMSADVNQNLKRVDLLISSAAVSDSALYYCALVPTVTGNPATLYKNLLLHRYTAKAQREVSTQKIEPVDPVKHVSEGETVTLSCSHSGSTADVLQWYRQFPTSRPEFLLFTMENCVPCIDVRSRCASNPVPSAGLAASFRHFAYKDDTPSQEKKSVFSPLLGTVL